MNTTFAPFIEATCVHTSGETAKASNPIIAATPGGQIQSTSSFFKPTILSWINAPYYHVPLSLKKEQSGTLHLNPEKESECATKLAPELASESASEFAPEVVAEAMLAAQAVQDTQDVPISVPTVTESVLETIPLEGFEVNRLAPQLLEVVCESHISHVQAIITILQNGGESAKTFATIFLNDLTLQQTVLNGLMGEPGNPLSQIEFLHKELALRLAACSQARQAAQLLLVDI